MTTTQPRPDIKAFIDARGLTQAQFAALLGIGPWAVGAWISGERDLCGKHAQRVAFLMDLPDGTDLLGELLGFEFAVRRKAMG